MFEYPTENGRIVNPYNAAERPTFLPGDKVSDKRLPGRLMNCYRCGTKRCGM